MRGRWLLLAALAATYGCPATGTVVTTYLTKRNVTTGATLAIQLRQQPIANPYHIQYLSELDWEQAVAGLSNPDVNATNTSVSATASVAAGGVRSASLLFSNVVPETGYTLTLSLKRTTPSNSLVTVATGSTALTINPGPNTANVPVALNGTNGKLSVTIPEPNLTVNTAPTITSLSPTSGGRNSTVTITGTGFSTTPANNSVTFNGAAATVSAATATQLTCTVPYTSLSGNVVVTVGGASSNSSAFTVTGPTITAVSPNSGNDENTAITVTLTGTGFVTGTANNTITLGGVSRTCQTVTPPSSLTFKTGIGGDGEIIVTVGGLTSNPGYFTDTGPNGGGGSGCPPPPYICP